MQVPSNEMFIAGLIVDIGAPFVPLPSIELFLNEKIVLPGDGIFLQVHSTPRNDRR